MSVVRIKYSFANALLFIMLLWVIKLLDWSLDIELVYYGVYPRKIVGLRGLLFAPLIHSDGYHLFNNSVGALFFLWSLFYFFPREWIKIFLLSYFLPNIFVWLFARPGYHIGFSGVIFSLAFFEFLFGILSRSRELMAISLIIVFLYGSFFWQIFPLEGTISWESHLFGALTGISLAIIYSRKYLKNNEIGKQTVYNFSVNYEFLEYSIRHTKIVKFLAYDVSLIDKKIVYLLSDRKE